MPNGTMNVIGHMTTDLGPVRATLKKNTLLETFKEPEFSFLTSNKCQIKNVCGVRNVDLFCLKIHFLGMESASHF